MAFPLFGYTLQMGRTVEDLSGRATLTFNPEGDSMRLTLVKGKDTIDVGAAGNDELAQLVSAGSPVATYSDGELSGFNLCKSSGFITVNDGPKELAKFYAYIFASALDPE